MRDRLNLLERPTDGNGEPWRAFGCIHSTHRLGMRRLPLSHEGLQGIEVSGQSVAGTMHAFQQYKSMANRYLLSEGVGAPGPDGSVAIDPQGWYPVEKWLAAFRRIGQEVGSSVLTQIGAGVMQNIQWPPGMTSVEGLVRFIDIGYHMHHRKNGRPMFDERTGAIVPGIGSFQLKGEDSHRYLVECENPYPCPFDKGILSGALRRLGTGSMAFHDENSDCRQKGGRRCTYVVYKRK
jgi:hypothetical protein